MARGAPSGVYAPVRERAWGPALNPVELPARRQARVGLQGAREERRPLVGVQAMLRPGQTAALMLGAELSRRTFWQAGPDAESETDYRTRSKGMWGGFANRSRAVCICDEGWFRCRHMPRVRWR